MKNILPVVNLLLLLALAAYVFFLNKDHEKKGYVLNQRIFDEFKGKKELSQKLVELKNAHQSTLDSMAAMITRQPANKQFVEQYHGTAQKFEIEQHALSERYTADIWKRINQYIAEYGKSKDYDFIFGATGEGNLMYAEDANNLTEEVIAYINKRYDEGD